MSVMRSLPRTIRFSFAAVAGVVTCLLLSTGIVHAATYSVTISPTGFIPATLKVQTGDTLEFRNGTTAMQSARSTLTTGFNTGDIGANQAKSVVVSNPGTFTYSSAYNAAITGSVEVSAATSSATTSATTTTTSTTSATKTSQPVQTQAQPVSGVFEVVVGMTLTGVLMLGGGIFWQRRLAYDESHENERSFVTNLPTISWKSEQEPPQEA